MNAEHAEFLRRLAKSLRIGGWEIIPDKLEEIANALEAK